MASFFTKSLCSLFRGARTSIPTIASYSAVPLSRWAPFDAVRAFHSTKHASVFDPLDLAENGFSPCISLLALARAEQQQNKQTAPLAKSFHRINQEQQEQELDPNVEVKQEEQTATLGGLDYSNSEDAYSERLFSDDDHSFFGTSNSPASGFDYSFTCYHPDSAESRPTTPLSIAELDDAEPSSPILQPIYPAALLARHSNSPLMDVDLDEIPYTPSPAFSASASFDDSTSSVRLISTSPSYPLISSPAPLSHCDGSNTLLSSWPTTPEERWSLAEVERAERGQASKIYEEEHLVGASRFYAPHLEVPRAKRVGGWGMPEWSEWSEEQVEAWAREEGI
ncbi:hypothetical protein BCR35DRAFT_336229 [Leucosporidium creatinivorum]|uniref:Uncharacterized protein n=1 Tax=Leucosporidium creatinivorum TaxID=106004 RepID=A0A1Y2CGY8_9BASI|nr:hypothetical protein BCR35DRAFT_336229 [Leucosporidium creatinivorum]